MNKLRPYYYRIALLLATAAFVLPRIMYASDVTPGQTDPTATGPAQSGGSLLSGILGIGDIGFTVFQWAAYFISYLIGVLGYITFTIQVFFLQFIIDMNFTIVNSVSVQFGFSIVLAFANILFVAAIIIMAVSTIIRYDTYGAKQILWKIVIAAIGVNFSLILAGTVISFADQATKYFMNASINQNPNQSSVGSEFQKGGFVDNLAGAFNPQRMMIANGITTSTTSSDQITALAKHQAGAASGMFAAIAGVFMTAIMVILLNIFFGVLLLAFLVRFIMLSLLLTIMPAVWLAWIFPFGRPLVNWWSDKFVKYTFFAPMAMFFLYLSMKSVEFLSSARILNNVNLEALDPGKSGGSANTVGSFITASLGALARPLVTSGLNFALVAGTLYGGLYFSSKLGIKAAGAGVAAFKSVGNSVKRRTITAAQTSAKNSATRTLDRIRTAGKDDKGNSWLTRTGGKLQERASNSRVASMLGAGIAGRALGNAGVADAKSVEERVKPYEDQYKNSTLDALLAEQRRIASGVVARNPDKEAALMKLIDKKKGMGAFAKSTSPETARAMKEWEDKWKKDNPDKQLSKKERSAQEKIFKEVNKAQEAEHEKNKKAQLERLQQSGALKDMKIPPSVAALLPKKKLKGTDRDMTELEAAAAQIGALKGEDGVALLLSEDGLFAAAKETEPMRKLPALLNTLGLQDGQVKEIGKQSFDVTRDIAESAKIISQLKESDALYNQLFLPEEADGTISDAARNDKNNENKVERRIAVAKAQQLLKSIEKNVNFTPALTKEEEAAAESAKATEEAEKKADKEELRKERLQEAQAIAVATWQAKKAAKLAAKAEKKNSSRTQPLLNQYGRPLS